MFKRVLALTAAFICLGAAAFAGDLSIGSPAPKLTVKSFVKGEPVAKFQKGKLYVVEFWATWCGPCKTSIPHLTELQKKYKNVKFIGVSVFEQQQSLVVPFVKQMGGKMNYAVAMDSVPAGQSGQNGLMAVNWMKAADQEGIPTAFIVDKDGTIAWIGHPMEMGEPLEKVVAGKWDKKAAAELMAKNKAAAKKMAAVQEKLGALYNKKDWDGFLSAMDSAVAENAEMKPQMLQILNSIAWNIVDPEAKKKPTEDDLKLALKMAVKADEFAEGKDPAIADTLGAAYFANKDYDKAIEAQERAVKYSKGTPFADDKTIPERLEAYKKAKN